MAVITGPGFEPDLQRRNHRLVAWLFLRALALVYFAAFASLAVQIEGLAGPNGILPLGDELASAARDHGGLAFFHHPSLFWLGTGPGVLERAAWVGCGLAVLVFLDLWTWAALVGLFVLYLSLFHAGQIFTFFQWDFLLLESGFLALFLGSDSKIVVWLYRWLLFRLRFMSGAAKLLSQDPLWAGFTALNAYFETQPLPHAGAFYAHHLPEAVHKAGVAAVFFVELIVPLMMFMPRRWRFFAAWTTILFQVLIMLTSNHNYFNLLTIALCLFLFDDAAVLRVMPEGWVRTVAARPHPTPAQRKLAAPFLGALTATILFMSGVHMFELFARRPAPAPLAAVKDALLPFRVANSYHVFAVMSAERIQMILEGSRDGRTWVPYPFRYMPVDPAKRPPVAIPHQPRLDALMWFLPSGDPRHARWFGNLLDRLLAGTPEVTRLLEADPFGATPPRAVRATLWRYRFTSPETRSDTGRWWDREVLMPFLPLPGRERPD